MMRNVPPPTLSPPIQTLIPGVPPPDTRQPLNIAQNNNPTYYQQQQPVPLSAPPLQIQQAQPSLLLNRQQQPTYTQQQLYSQPVQQQQQPQAVSQQAYAPSNI